MVLAVTTNGCITLVRPLEHDNTYGSSKKIQIAVGFVRQDAPTFCGIAALDMLTGYYRQPLGLDAEQGLKEEAIQTGGISGKSLKLALEEAGYDAFIFPGTLNRLASGIYPQIDLGRPVIVMIGIGPRHYCVVVGYDEQQARIVVLDPAQGICSIPISDFVTRWREAHYFTLLAVPKAKVEPSAHCRSSAGPLV